MDELTAWHESGHAFMAICLGATVHSVTIDPDRDDGPERFGDAQIEWPPEPRTTRERLESLIRVALAGPVAEMLYSGDPFHPGMVPEWAMDWQHAWQVAAALFAGGLLAALVGLVGWIGGAGTVADGLRRLVGPHFSPNHTALYLERTLFLGLGLWFGIGRRTGRARRAFLGIGAALALVGVALLLTASRGALLLALPAGLAVFVWSAPVRRVRVRGIVLGSIIGGLAVAALALLVMLPRLANTATVLERVDIWRATMALWRDVPVFGVGAGGFYWTFPAYIPVQAAIDPNLRHPHSVWLETLAGWGVLGMVWMLGLLVQMTRAGFALRHREGLTDRNVWLGAGLLAGLAAGFAHGQVDAFGTLPDLAGWNWVALALLAQMTPSLRRENRRAARQHVPPDGPAETGE